MNNIENNIIMNWKDKFIISWLNKKADINSKCQQIFNEINNLQAENKKIQFIELLNKIKNVCYNITNLSNKQQDETIEFLFYRSKNNQGISEQELWDALDNIRTYFLMKEKNIQGLPKFLRDIKSFDELQNVINNFSSKLNKYSTVLTGEFGDIVSKYKIYEFTDLNRNKYEVFKIPKSNNQEDINALRVLVYGRSGYQNGIFNKAKAEGRWCVLKESMAEDYLSQDDFFVIYQNGRVFAGLGTQSHNCVNRINKKLNIYEWSVLLKPFLHIARYVIERRLPSQYYELYNYIIETNNSGELWLKEKIKNINNIKEITKFCLENKYRYKEQEDNIIQYLIEKEYIKSLYKYAKICIRGRFKQNDIGQKAEKLIVQDVEYAYKYAFHCLSDKQWDENTEVGQIALNNITQNIKYSFEYVKNCLSNKQWDENTKYGQIALDNITNNAEYALNYAKEFLSNKQWKENTKYGQIALTTIAQNAQYAYYYAKDCLLDKQWDENSSIGQLALNTISQNAQYAYLYAKDCLPNHQWSENTPWWKLAIKTLKNSEYWGDYCKLSRR